ncbi:MAG: hypothetical protein Q9162_002007 [Coniocarpon cinnabarinum]
MSTSKAQEAGLAGDDDDNASVTSSFVDVRQASPAPSISTTTLDPQEPPTEPPAYSQLPVPPTDEPTWTSHDPRAASTESLLNEAPNQDGKRRLLLVYVHGFLGNETSFQSFPAHVHNLLTILLSGSHVVHTKIYPRYRTKQALQLAANDFSEWLSPNQDSKTDVVLLGHSLGGFLATDVALLRNSGQNALRHRLLGTISFDSPFLGMHPGVVWSGITSLFRPTPTPLKSPEPGDIPPSDTFTQMPTSDAHYNPTFANDVNLPTRTGWANTLHFVNKHSKNLHKATKKLATSHVEFGSELADGKKLKRRYSMIKALDSEDDATRAFAVDGHSRPKRTRFTNYYTACSGRPKKPRETSHDQMDTPSEHSEQTQPSISLDAAARPALSEQGAGETPSTSPVGTDPPARDRDSVSIRSVSTSDVVIPETGAVPNSRSYSNSPANRDSPRLMPHPFAQSALRSPSPTPSNMTLPSYTTEAPALDPAPRYPASSRASYVASPRSATTRSTSSISSSSLSTFTSQEGPPTPIGPPPVPSDYPSNKIAYAADLKNYLKASKEYAHAVRRYHKSQVKQRLAGTRSSFERKKAVQAAQAEERALELEIREEERRRINEAPTPEARQVEIEAMRERRQRETQLRRDEFRTQVEQMQRSVQDGGTTGGRDFSDWCNMTREERRAARQYFKEERKASKDVAKEQRKFEKASRKGSRHNTIASPSETIPTSIGTTEGSTELPHDYRTQMQSPSSAASASVPFWEKTQEKAPLRTRIEDNKIRDKRFCRLPPKDASGNRDPCWQRVFLQDVDEVGAHCGMFFPQGAEGAEAIEGQVWGERYAWLVADVAERIETWAHDDLTERLVNGIDAL